MIDVSLMGFYDGYFRLRYPMTFTQLREVITNIRNGYFTLDVNQRLYVNASVMLFLFLANAVLFGYQNAKDVFVVFVVFWTAAICYDLVSVYKRVYETVVGKAFLILLVSLCTNLAIVLSSQVINDITGVDPSKFPHTIALLSILSIPLFITVAFGISSFILIAAIPFLVMFHSLPDERTKEIVVPGYTATPLMPYHKTTRVIQLVSFTVFCGVVFLLSQKLGRSYETFVTDTARSFMYQLEMYPKAPCEIEQGGRVAFISSDKVLVGIKKSEGTVFKVQECKSGSPVAR